VAAESIDDLTARSSKAAMQHRNAVARYLFQLLNRHDAMAIASVPIPSSRDDLNVSKEGEGRPLPRLRCVEQLAWLGFLIDPDLRVIA
jgi:hypothetical protein